MTWNGQTNKKAYKMTILAYITEDQTNICLQSRQSTEQSHGAHGGKPYILS